MSGSQKLAIVLSGLLAIVVLLPLITFLKTASVSQNPISVKALDLSAPIPDVVLPSSAPNDLDSNIIINGINFMAELSGTQLITAPTVYLGHTLLDEVGWVSTTTMTATVPWGMDTGVYTLTVINPDGTPGSLANAFTVTLGIGQWNGSELYGGGGLQILFKPGDPDTMYALGGEVGLFRSRDAGETWQFIYAEAAGHPHFTLDPHNPAWLYSARGSLYRSQDEGDSWNLLLNTWPDGQALGVTRVFVSPVTPGKLFFSASVQTYTSDPTALGLITSDDYGASWQIIADLDGIPVTDLDFHPTDPQQLALVTNDGQIFQSIDGGDHWGLITGTPSISDLELITYNPFNPGEVWIGADYREGLREVWKGTAFSNWQNMNPIAEPAVSSIEFTSADTVYMAEIWGNGYKSENGGLNWQPFGAATMCCRIAFHPSYTQTIYAGDTTYGVQKSTDGGQTWQIKNQGFTAMYAGEIEASPSIPQRVFATFGSWKGIFRSHDGAAGWAFLPILDSWNVRVVREDPFEPDRIYVASDPALYFSGNDGLDWTAVSWDYGLPSVMEPDPHQPGRLLAGFQLADMAAHQGQLFSSDDYGLTWNPISVTQAVTISWISDIVYHPEQPGLVYMSTDGSGLYRSGDSGETWERIDDQNVPAMKYLYSIGIATHPQPMLIVQARGPAFRSFDGGNSWESVVPQYGSPQDELLFVDNDSTRLYAGTRVGLFFSADGGQSWTPAAGSLGHLHVTALDAATFGGNTILYAATTGGDIHGNNGQVFDHTGLPLRTENDLIKAGVYRFVLRTWQTFLPLVRR